MTPADPKESLTARVARLAALAAERERRVKEEQMELSEEGDGR